MTEATTSSSGTGNQSAGKDVLVRHSNGVGQLILNRPKQRNSLTGPLVRELQSGLESLLADPNCAAIVVSGAEGYFCAGLDLKAFSADPEPAWKADFQTDWARFHETVYRANVPIIGAIEGFAIAGGSSLALACDFLVIGKRAFFQVSEVERNMLAPLNVFWLTQRYGYQLALRMALLGQTWVGDELVQAGLAERSVPDGEVLSEAMVMANRFARFDRGNVKALKYSIKQGVGEVDFYARLATIKQALPL